MQANQAPKSTCLDNDTVVWMRAWLSGTRAPVTVSSAKNQKYCLSRNMATRTATRAMATTAPIHRAESLSTTMGDWPPAWRDSVVYLMPWTYVDPATRERNETSAMVTVPMKPARAAPALRPRGEVDAASRKITGSNRAVAYLVALARTRATIVAITRGEESSRSRAAITSLADSVSRNSAIAS